MSFLGQLPRITRPQSFLNPAQAARCGFQKGCAEFAYELVVAAANLVQCFDDRMGGDFGPAMDGLEGCVELGLADGLGKIVVETRFQAAVAAVTRVLTPPLKLRALD